MTSDRTEAAAIETIRDRVRAVSGLAVAGEHAFHRALTARVRATGARTAQAYAEEFLREDRADELDALVQETRNGETYFFRDHGQMTLLRETLIPRILDRRRKEHRVRVWSVGCSTGEEVYSIAILFDELTQQRAGWRFHILGTDIHEASLQRAREGLYGTSSFRPQAPAGERARESHFEPEADGWRISRRIRQMVRFEPHNVARDPLGPQHKEMDLIVCRNVIIYLDRDAARTVSAKLADALATGGTLIAGHTEIHGRAPPGLRATVHPESVVYERKAPRAAARRRPPTPPASRPPPRRSVERSTTAREREPEPPAAHARPEHAESVVPADARDRAEQAADLGLHEAAAEEARAVLRHDPDDARMQQLLALVATELGDEEEAKSRLRKTIYLEPANIEAHLHLALVYESEGDDARARRLRQTALALTRDLDPQTLISGFDGLTAAALAHRLSMMLIDDAQGAGVADA